MSAKKITVQKVCAALRKGGVRLSGTSNAPEVSRLSASGGVQVVERGQPNEYVISQLRKAIEPLKESYNVTEHSDSSKWFIRFQIEDRGV